MKIYSDKKVLLFCPTFYNYRQIVKDELENLGAKVIDYDERPSNSIVFKILLRLRQHKLLNIIISKYYNEIIDTVDNITDVFFINVEAVNREHILKMKSKFGNAKFTLYMWDSIKNKNNVLNIVDEFDRVCSFDPEDCKVNTNFIFEPLFYNRFFEKSTSQSNLKYDVSFVGSIHSDRLSIIKKINNCNKIKCKFFLYSPSRLFTYLKIITLNGLSFRDRALISNKKIAFDEVSEIFFSSRSIIDVQHPNQKGLTMRTFEVLGSCRKLITTNSDIKNYDFYNSNNILVIDRENIDKAAIEQFLNIKFQYDLKFKSYRIDKWLKRVLN